MGYKNPFFGYKNPLLRGEVGLYTTLAPACAEMGNGNAKWGGLFLGFGLGAGS